MKNIGRVIMLTMIVVSIIVFYLVGVKFRVPKDETITKEYNSFFEYRFVPGGKLQLNNCMSNYKTVMNARKDSIIFTLHYGQKIGYKTIKITPEALYGEIKTDVTKFSLTDSLLIFKTGDGRLFVLAVDKECPKK